MFFCIYREDKIQWCLLYFKILNTVFCICFLFYSNISHLSQDGQIVLFVHSQGGFKDIELKLTTSPKGIGMFVALNW